MMQNYKGVVQISLCLVDDNADQKWITERSGNCFSIAETSEEK